MSLRLYSTLARMPPGAWVIRRAGRAFDVRAARSARTRFGTLSSQPGPGSVLKEDLLVNRGRRI